MSKLLTKEFERFGKKQISPKIDAVRVLVEIVAAFASSSLIASKAILQADGMM